MRISMIGCKGIPAATSQGGGIETHVEELATRLAARGHHVTVYVRPYANMEHRKMWNGVHLITLPSIHRKNLDAISHTFLSSLHVLFRRADIVHYHGVGPATLAWIPRVFKSWAKVVVTFHSRDRYHEKWSRFARTYLTFGEWAAVRFPHATIAASHVIQVFCRKLKGSNVLHIPNGVEIPRLHPGDHELARFGLKPGGYFFTLSRLVPHKAIEDAITAYQATDTQKKLVIIGTASYDDVQYEKRLKAMAAGNPNILFLGHQVDPALKQLIANGFAMIHPSRSEGLSVAVLEAMSFGKLVIMSDIPENLELIDHSGISFRVGDVSGLREVIRWADGEPKMAEERGARARDVVKRIYSWDSVVDRTEALYRSLLRV